jgi:chemotaxis signal transduction protein
MNPEELPDIPARCVSFNLADECFGVDVLQVREVLQNPDLTSVPGAGPACVGVTNLRGRIVSVLDLRQLLSLPPAAGGGSPHLLVVERGNRLIGLLVDDVGEVVSTQVREDEITNSSAAGSDGLGAMIHRDGRFVVVLALDSLLPENAS